jgi:hypothetical protein
VLQERHEYHRPVDWKALDREAKRRARQAAQESTHVPVVSPDRRSPLKVPPITRTYYAGEHLRAEREKYNRFLNAQNDARAAAVRRRQAALRYAAEATEKLRKGNGGGRRVQALAVARSASLASHSPSRPPQLIRRMSGPEDTTADKNFPHTKAGLFQAVRVHQGLDTVKVKSQGSPGTTADASQVTVLAMKATELNHRVDSLEKQVQASGGRLRGALQRCEDAANSHDETKEAEANWSNVLGTNADLCSTYIEAIMTKVKLFEALRAA